MKSKQEAESELFEVHTLSDLPEMRHSAMGPTETDTAILLQHGFCGSNLEMLYLANFLAKEGIRVLLPLLPGHGATSEALLKVNQEDWKNTVREGLEYLTSQNQYKHIFLGGHSLGGALALNLANEYPNISGILSLAGPVQYSIPFRFLVKMVGKMKFRIPFEEFHFYDERLYEHPGMKNFLENYGKVPLKAFGDVFHLLNETYKELPQITIPTCLIYSELDKTVPAYHATKIRKKIGTHDLEMHWMSKSYHILLVDEDRDLVAQKAFQFIQRIIKSKN